MSSMDSINLAILASRFDGIVREMTNTMLRSARSGVINSARDFSCAITTGDGRLFSCAEGLPIHIFGSDIQSRYMCEMHPDIAEGDCYLHNDPYTGNTHPADHTILIPIFWEKEHVFTAVAKAHQADIGNSQPTTYMADAKDVYEEGALIFPAVRIQRGYQMVEEVIRMGKSRIRSPNQWYGDLLAGIASARVAEKRIKAIIDRFGLPTMKDFIEEWLDYSERRMMNVVESIPSFQIRKESFHDPVRGIELDGIPVRISISVDNSKKEIIADLTENIGNIPCGLNLSESTSISAALAGIFNALPGDIPRNSGSFRRVKILLRDGAIIGRPQFPHSCSVATTNIADRLVNLSGSAFGELGAGFGLAEGAVGLGIGMAVISGSDPQAADGGYVNQVHLGTNGGPASAQADGWVTYGIPVVSGLMYRDSIEVDELKYPMHIRSLKLATGTGGAGQYRGAPGSIIEYGPTKAPMRVIYPGDGQTFPPKGVRGGHNGNAAERWLYSLNGQPKKLGNAESVLLKPGEFVRGVDCSGGGYGDPLTRDPAKVVKDVYEKYETKERAREVYGVILVEDDGGKLTFSAKETAELRKQLENILSIE